MMLLIEYLNVLTHGNWQNRLREHKWGQYILAAALAALPGCLGHFAIVSMYAHRMLTFGAVVSAMIATSGDESFVMLAMVPKEGLMITLILFVLGVFAGALTDLLIGDKILFQNVVCEGYTFHPAKQCECFLPWEKIKKQWRHCSADRGVLSFFLVTFLFMLISDIMGPQKVELDSHHVTDPVFVGIAYCRQRTGSFLEKTSLAPCRSKTCSQGICLDMWNPDSSVPDYREFFTGGNH